MEILLVLGLVLLILGPGRFSLLGKSVKKSVKDYKDELKDDDTISRN
ncbi:twin-arginine translocase TatA/TatE family subunit [Tindallia californiensis]|uniref:Sec-independent protein translocase protein TatA n=1 Tax=Tindallia californiensis TaxID=159292 RepID=A0A1H3K3R4_9FIRM|nr:twin-arginine translocase TatA/TatE family subunit [Tindallia californiensis]SDY46469.1 sec-independent protein translocase protein TatA [Tindallia californiensis]